MQPVVPLTINPMPALPQCDGEQWIISAPDGLAELCAIVLVGQAIHAAEILDGTEAQASGISPGLKAELHKELHPTTQQTIEHRDGLLFEIICWVATRLVIDAEEALSEPHLKSTNQGTDGVKVTVDPSTKTLIKATVYEYKCTTNARSLFQGKVLKAFQEYVSGKRDNQLSQSAVPLLRQLGFSGKDLKGALDTLIKTRPLAFQASLTVAPAIYPAAKCLALFKDYDSIPVVVTNRGGNTLPLDDVRPWFAAFSKQVWAAIDALGLIAVDPSGV